MLGELVAAVAAAEAAAEAAELARPLKPGELWRAVLNKEGEEAVRRILRRAQQQADVAAAQAARGSVDAKAQAEMQIRRSAAKALQEAESELGTGIWRTPPLVRAAESGQTAVVGALLGTYEGSLCLLPATFCLLLDLVCCPACADAVSLSLLCTWC